MAKWASANVLEQGPKYIKDNCDKMLLLATYTAGDSYATITSGSNVLAEVTMASGDFTLAASGSDRTLTTASGKSDASANATAASSSTKHIAFVKSTATTEVLWVTEETTGQAITAGNQVNFPSLVYTVKQPVAP